MSFFDKIFGGSEDQANDSLGKWTPIKSIEDLDKAAERSKEVPVVLFKHSTRCFISKTVLGNFEKEMKAFQGDAEFYFLDLLAHRNVSNEIEKRFKVVHQSPQMIVLKNGKVVNDASHHSISINLLNA